MTLQASGPITLAQIQGEYGGANPISMSEYYRGGGLVPSGNTSISASGAIAMSQFYGTSNVTPGAWDVAGGSYTFYVPNYNNITFQLWGAGCGGNSAHYSLYSGNPPPNPGGNTDVVGILGAGGGTYYLDGDHWKPQGGWGHAAGGGGETGGYDPAYGYNSVNGGAGANGGGGGSGGGGGGWPGGGGSGAISGAAFGTLYGSGGGGGGYSALAFSKGQAGAPAPGSALTVNVGWGGPGSQFPGYNPGGPGAQGRAYISWN